MVVGLERKKETQRMSRKIKKQRREDITRDPMTEDMLSRIRDTLCFLEDLNEKQDFDFGCGFLVEAPCDEDCVPKVPKCIAGWYPDWFPEAGLVWKKCEGGGGTLVQLSAKKSSVVSALSRYHGITSEETRALFFGDQLLTPFLRQLPRREVRRKEFLPASVSLECVVERWKTFYEFKKTMMSCTSSSSSSSSAVASEGAPHSPTASA